MRAAGVAALLLTLWLSSYAAVARADEAEGHYRIGLDNERKGDLVAAAREVHEAVRLRPTHAAAWLTLGAIERKQGHLDASLEAFEQVIKLAPKEPQAYAL